MYRYGEIWRYDISIFLLIYVSPLLQYLLAFLYWFIPILFQGEFGLRVHWTQSRPAHSVLLLRFNQAELIRYFHSAQFLYWDIQVHVGLTRLDSYFTWGGFDFMLWFLMEVISPLWFCWQIDCGAIKKLSVAWYIMIVVGSTKS